MDWYRQFLLGCNLLITPNFCFLKHQLYCIDQEYTILDYNYPSYNQKKHNSDLGHKYFYLLHHYILKFELQWYKYNFLKYILRYLLFGMQEYRGYRRYCQSLGLNFEYILSKLDDRNLYMCMKDNFKFLCCYLYCNHQKIRLKR